MNNLLILPRGRLTRGFLTKTLYAYLLSPILATCPAQYNLLYKYFTVLTVTRNQHKPRSSSLSNILNRPVHYVLLRTQYFSEHTVFRLKFEYLFLLILFNIILLQFNFFVHFIEYSFITRAVIAVGIALGYGLDSWGSRVRFRAGTGNFSLHHRVHDGSGVHPASYPMGTRGSFPGGKAAGAWSWPLTSI
jgi:hypothetical protein